MSIQCESRTADIRCQRKKNHDGPHAGPWRRDEDGLPKHRLEWADHAEDSPFTVEEA